MRALLLITGAALALGGCGNNDQTDKTQNADENLTAENIVSNDVLTRPAPKKAAPKAVTPKPEPAANAATNAE